MGGVENAKDELMSDYLIKGGTIINEGKRFISDLLIRNGCIAKIGLDINVPYSVTEINAETKEITLMGTDGGLVTMTAGEEVERFDEIAVDDVIKFE